MKTGYCKHHWEKEESCLWENASNYNEKKNTAMA